MLSHCLTISQSFNAPKGWIYFLSGAKCSKKLVEAIVSMPRRAYFVFHRWEALLGRHRPDCFNAPKGLFCISPRARSHQDPSRSCRFNAPKGLFCISPGHASLIAMHTREFQCPEGLILYFTVRYAGEVSRSAGNQFQCPEGLILYFTGGWDDHSNRPCLPEVSMPRRAYFVFHR